MALASGTRLGPYEILGARQTTGMQQSLEVPRPFLETGGRAVRRFGDLAKGNPR